MLAHSAVVTTGSSTLDIRTKTPRRVQVWRLFGRLVEYSYHHPYLEVGRPNTGGDEVSTGRMARLWPGLLCGAAAGAAGTTALNVITYLDIAIRGRPTSTTPEMTVEAMARLVGLTIPGTGDVLANRISGLGALTGYAAGIGMGIILGLAYALGWQPRLFTATAVAAAIALVATNGPMTVLGVTDPRTWGLVGWISDVIPHLGYGVVTALLLHYLCPLFRPQAEVEPSEASDLAD